MRGSETADRDFRSRHGTIEVKPNLKFKAGLAENLNALRRYGEPLEFRSRFATSHVPFDALIRAAIRSTACESIGHGVRIDAYAGGKKDVPPFPVVARVPSKIMRFRDKQEVEASSESST